MVIITSTFLPIQINTCTIKTYKYTNYCINLHFIRMKLTKNAKILHLHLLGLNLLTDIVDFPFSQWFFDWRDNFYHYDWSHPFFLWLLTFYTVFILTKTNLATYILFSPTNCMHSETNIVCGSTWVPEDASTQATSEYIKCKHWKYHKNKNNYIIYVTNLLEPWYILI